MRKNYQKELSSLGKIKSQFASKGWMPATSGNFSLRVQEDPLQFFISVSGRDKSIQREDDFILVDEKGNPVNKTALKPSAEVGVHAALYKKVSPLVVLHIHTLYNTLVSRNISGYGTLVFEGLEMIKGLDRWEENSILKVPVIPNFHQLDKLASSAEESVNPLAPGLLIKGHGLYAWGNTLHEAKRNVEAFEFLFRYSILEAQIKGGGNGSSFKS